jgi:hypothetical protein
MYVFYVKVFHGLTSIKRRKIGGFTPKNVSYEHFLDSLNNRPLKQKKMKPLFSQYYKLREALKNIEQ